jgi:hypothetical protein
MDNTEVIKKKNEKDKNEKNTLYIQQKNFRLSFIFIIQKLIEREF